MKFRLTRTSDYGDSACPHPLARLEETNAERKADAEAIGLSLRKREYWIIELNTLEELIAFGQETGQELVLDTSEPVSIEIYDAYRE